MPATDLEMEYQICLVLDLGLKMCIERLFSNEIYWDLCEAVNKMWKPGVCRLDMSVHLPLSPPPQHSHKNITIIFEKQENLPKKKKKNLHKQLL